MYYVSSAGQIPGSTVQAFEEDAALRLDFLQIPLPPLTSDDVEATRGLVGLAVLPPLLPPRSPPATAASLLTEEDAAQKLLSLAAEPPAPPPPTAPLTHQHRLPPHTMKL